MREWWKIVDDELYRLALQFEGFWFHYYVESCSRRLIKFIDKKQKEKGRKKHVFIK